jgi:hypothetical protein
MRKKCIFTVQFEYDDSNEVSQKFVDEFFTEDELSSIGNDPELVWAGIINVEANFNITDM